MSDACEFCAKFRQNGIDGGLYEGGKSIGNGALFNVYYYYGEFDNFHEFQRIVLRAGAFKIDDENKIEFVVEIRVDGKVKPSIDFRELALSALVNGVRVLFVPAPDTDPLVVF